MEQPKEVLLAYEIATKLNDLHSIDWHISICKERDPEFLINTVNYILSHKNIENKAGYYNRVVTQNGKHPRR